MRLLNSIFAFFVLCGLTAAAEVVQPSIESYGELPTVRMMSLSPDGDTIAFVSRIDGKDVLTIYDVESGELSGRVSIDNIATRGISFPDNDHVLI